MSGEIIINLHEALAGESSLLSPAWIFMFFFVIRIDFFVF